MGGIPVLFNDNHYKVVSGNELDQLLTTGRVKAFRRSTEWDLIGHDPLRGKGGKSGKFRGGGKKKTKRKIVRQWFKI